MLNVQKYLLENGIQALKDNYGIIVKEYEDEPVIVLNYSQIDSPKNDPITNECRGLILSSDFETVLCRSFDRFFNCGEANETVENLGDYTILEKLDGSLINVWFYPKYGSFEASTRGTAFAEAETMYGPSFWEIIENNILDVPIPVLCDNFNINYTYIFELTSPYNRVVKHHTESKLTLIGIRSNKTGEFFSYDELRYFHSSNLSYHKNIELVDKYEFSSIDEIMNKFDDSNPFDEGYVIWNEKNGHRVKIKNPAYVAIHHLRNNGVLAPKNIVHLVHKNEHEEYLSYFETDREFFQPYIDAYNKMVEDINQLWDTVKDIEDQKTFALHVKDKPFAGIMFSMKKGFTFKEACDKINIKKLTEFVEKYKDV